MSEQVEVPAYKFGTRLILNSDILRRATVAILGKYEQFHSHARVRSP